jgi:glutathione S-transferase
MKLYGSYTSPFVRHCRIVLLETGIDCEFIETDLAASAVKSPTKRVPFLEDGDIFLTDSSAIIKHLREKAGSQFCATTHELNKFCLVNSVLDTVVNLFFIKRDGVDISSIPYLQRQAARIQSTLEELNNTAFALQAPYDDADLRLGSFMSWAILRNQIDFSRYPQLEKFYQAILTYDAFAKTSPTAH